jgi:ABC-type uncharacterized transport system fused permease/ATPase subunit
LTFLTARQNEFWKRIGQWMLLGVPACMTNSMIKYMEIKIACLFRERLTSEAVKQYMSSNTFYSVANLDGRLGNADQCLTNDIEKFSQHLSHLCVSLRRCRLLSPPPSRAARAAGTLRSASPSSTSCS